MNLGQLQIAKAERQGTITPRYAVFARKQDGQTGREASRLHVYDLQRKEVVVTFIGEDKRSNADEACQVMNTKAR